MTESANVRSVDAIRYFHAAVLKFQEEARLCVSALEMQMLRFLGWIERERPGFWKREIENCYRELSEARVRLHQCRMKKMGDYKPTCFEETKDLERAKRALEYSQKQVPVVKHWIIQTHHEANEYHGRSAQLTQMIERDIPQLLALLHQAVDWLEAYQQVQFAGSTESFAAPATSSEQQQVTQDEADPPSNDSLEPASEQSAADSRNIDSDTTTASERPTAQHQTNISETQSRQDRER